MAGAWHAQTAEDVLTEFKVAVSDGLPIKEVLARERQYGKNTFVRTPPPTIISRILGQLKSPLALILVVACAITIGLGELVDAGVIALALLVNTFIGVLQEGRADKAFEALLSKQTHSAVVRRGGAKLVVRAEELVPGDIVILEAGQTVPADIRLLNTQGLELNEASLTGEWAGIAKDVEVLPEETPLPKRHNMAWMGSLITTGAATGVVVATGHDTYFGDIATHLGKEEEVITPIQKNIRHLARFVAILVTVVTALIFVLGIAYGQTFTTMLLIAVAVAVSVVPEGLPAAVTIVLAIGMEKLSQRGGLVRNLRAAETLGSTTVILTDKTGTLTQAALALSGVYVPQWVLGNAAAKRGAERDVLETLRMAMRASDAFVEKSGDKLEVRGRPVERALVSAGLFYGALPTDDGFEPVGSIPFESSVRLSFGLFKKARRKMQQLSFAGAPENVLAHATKMLKNGRSVRMTKKDKEGLTRFLERETKKGLRVIGVGYRDVQSMPLSPVADDVKGKDLIQGAVFAGFVSFTDPVRPDAQESIAHAKGAGIRVIMLTGDNPETARAVALAVGIARPRSKVLLGSDIEALSDGELRDILSHVDVFARVLPTQKRRIARVLKESGHRVAMTGDGVNDAPALRRADIGIALGSGTEVAREAADLVLLDDNFSVIVAAIEEGRRIIDNLKRIVTHLLSTSFHEVFIITTAVLFGFPLPVLAVQILWVNIIEEGMLNFGFAFEPAEKDVMRRDPAGVETQSVLTKKIRNVILIAGTITGIFSTLLYLGMLGLNIPIESIRTIIFIMLTLDALLFAVSLKRLSEPFWHGNFLNNKYLLGALGISTFLLALTLSLPALRALLSLVIVPWPAVLVLCGVGVFNILTIEGTKWFIFRRKTA